MNNLLPVLFIYVVACSKSQGPPSNTQLLTSSPWILERLDTTMRNSNTIINLGSYTDSCYSGTVLTFNTDGTLSYTYICGNPLPTTVTGHWSLTKDSILTTSTVNVPEEVDTIRVLTSQSLSLEIFGWYYATPTYPYPYHLTSVYTH
jgi:hypothetical protein